MDAKERQEACDRARTEVSKMSREEREELHTAAMKLVFPGGYWSCSCVSEFTVATVAKGEKCQFCGQEEMQ